MGTGTDQDNELSYQPPADRTQGAHKPTWKQLIFDRPYNNRHLDMPRMSDWRKWREAVFPMLEKTFAMH